MCYTNSAAARATDARCTRTLYCRCMRAAEGEGQSIRFICAHETTGARSSNTTLHPTSPPCYNRRHVKRVHGSDSVHAAAMDLRLFFPHA